MYRERHQNYSRVIKIYEMVGIEFKENQERKFNKIKGFIQSAKGASKIDLSKLYRTSIYELER